MDGVSESTQRTRFTQFVSSVARLHRFFWRETQMHIRAATAAFFILILPLVAAGADQPNIDELVKKLGSGKPADQLQAADDLADLGRSAKPAVPALVKALGSSDVQLQW